METQIKQIKIQNYSGEYYSTDNLQDAYHALHHPDHDGTNVLTFSFLDGFVASVALESDAENPQSVEFLILPHSSADKRIVVELLERLRVIKSEKTRKTAIKRENGRIVLVKGVASDAHAQTP